MTSPAKPLQMFSERTDSYLRFIRSVGYQRGLRAYFAGSPLLRPGLRVLDAGCGAGAALLAVRGALRARGLDAACIHGFDLTPAMLDRLRTALEAREGDAVELAQADVLQLETLASTWTGYDLIVSASMLEYVPRDRFAHALSGLRARLDENGTFVLFITRRNWLMRPLIGRWWAANLYTAEELRRAFAQAGFSHMVFRRFPLPYRHLDLWGFIVEAGRG